MAEDKTPSKTRAIDLILDTPPERMAELTSLNRREAFIFPVNEAVNTIYNLLRKPGSIMALYRESAYRHKRSLGIVGLEELKTVADFHKLFENKEIPMFDDSPSYEEQNRPRLNEYLTETEIEDALFWHPFMRGVMLVSGPPGAGKGLVSNTLGWKAKRYYKKKIAILDYKPRELFGFYIPFNIDMLIEQLERLREIAGWSDKSFDAMEEVVEFQDKHQWRSSRGDVFLNNSIMVLDEFHKIMDRRLKHPVGHVVGDICKFWRHMNLLIVGVTTQKTDLDYKRFQKAITAEIRCGWERKLYKGRRTSSIAKIQQKQFIDSGGGVIQGIGKVVKKRFDGAEPRDALGGKTWFDLFNSTNVQEIGIPNSLRRMK